ncbi:hypothetical protein [Pedobacter agri]|uniref:Crp/Fnr family transcriptional regulator n=1 Tax=Pedobacter agri TaxID=454586 RepID=UPI002931C251|nr:hypothetical protein [Pedobacter agri]
MSFEIFKDYLASHVPLDENLLAELQLRTKEFTISKGNFLLLPGEVNRYTYFIASGFFRSFTHEEGFDRTLGFFGSGELCCLTTSYLKQQKSKQGILCEQEGTVYRVSYYDWRALEDISAEFLRLTKKILTDELLKLIDYNELIRTSSTTEQYLSLKKHHPNLSMLVSQKSIASYLGISESTMSGIIKSLLFSSKK